MSKRYAPNSKEAVDLLTAAAVRAGLPASWGASPAAHAIMGKESGGWVGRPNYTFGTAVRSAASAPAWPAIWARLKSGEIWTKSTATGLGQLLTSNVKKFYPDGLAGIGDPMNEAVGFLRYIHTRYGSPEVALSVYGKLATYTHAVTGAHKYKGFKEGY